MTLDDELQEFIDGKPVLGYRVIRSAGPSGRPSYVVLKHAVPVFRSESREEVRAELAAIAIRDPAPPGIIKEGPPPADPLRPPTKRY